VAASPDQMDPSQNLGGNPDLECGQDGGGVDEDELPQALGHDVAHALLVALAVGQQQRQDACHARLAQLHLPHAAAARNHLPAQQKEPGKAKGYFGTPLPYFCEKGKGRDSMSCLPRSFRDSKGSLREEDLDLALHACPAQGTNIR